ncbi:MAG: discoidin domain-containing protein [Bacteroidaceae bacterium]
MSTKLFLAVCMCSLMTTARAQVTFECIGGTDFDAGEGCAKAFDGNLKTKWGMYGTGDKFAVIKASDPVRITGYTLVNANDNQQHNRDIKEWEIYGTNDENIASTNQESINGWTRFERVREHNIGKNDYSAHHFAVNPSGTAFKYFMFKRVAGSEDGTQLSEITLAYTQVPGIRQGIGYTYLSGTAGFGDDQDADRLFDDHWNTKFCGNADAEYNVTFTTSKAINVSKVTLSTANDSNGRDPKAWSLYGSVDDGSTWELIHSHNENLPVERETAKAFEFTTSSTAYSTFKFVIRRTRDDNGEQKMQLSELSLNDETMTYSVIEATAGFSDNESAPKLFDGDTGTKWCCPNRESTRWFVEFTTDQAIAPTGYFFVTGNDDNSRDPKAWTLYGSSDEGKTWTAIDTKTDQTFPDMRRDYVEYTMTPPATPYSRYRLEVTERRGGDKGLVQYSEFGLLTTSNNSLTKNNQIIIYEGDGGSSKESVQKMFDGDPETKWCTGPTYTVFGIGHEATMSGYSIHEASEFGNYDRRPKSWILQGSNDYSTWTDIDVVTGDTRIPGACLSLTHYVLDTPVTYKYYKFQINETQGANIFQLSEFVPHFDGGTLNKLELRDGTEPTICGNATIGEFVYDRSLTTGNVSTFILPVDMPVSNVNGTVWQLSEYDGSALRFAKVEEGTLSANKPYLVQPSADKLLKDNTLSNASLHDIPTTLKQTTTEGQAYQMGTYTTLKSEEAITEGTVYGYTGGKFVQAQSGTLRPFRTLFVVTGMAEAKELTLVLGDTETGIVTLSQNGEITDTPTDVYDLSGRMVRRGTNSSTCLIGLPAGTYVAKGKKFIIK